MRNYADSPTCGRLACANQAAVDQKNTAEQHLSDLLSDLCKSLGIGYTKKAIGKDLLLEVVNNPKIKYSNGWKQKCAIYDASYKLIKSLGIKISPKFSWLTNIKEHILQQN